MRVWGTVFVAVLIWRSGRISCELLIMNFVVALGYKEGGVLSEHQELGL